MLRARFGWLTHASKRRMVRACWGGGLAALLTGAVWAPVWAQANLPIPDSGENTWRELGTTPPEYPKSANLIKFPTNWTSAEVFVDGQTLSIDADKVVRYTLVIKSAGGAENVSYEGMRCETQQLRVYAFGRRDGTWSPSRTSAWRDIRDSTINRHHFEFLRDVFCVQSASEPRSEILKNLRTGGRVRPQSTTE